MFKTIKLTKLTWRLFEIHDKKRAADKTRVGADGDLCLFWCRDIDGESHKAIVVCERTDIPIKMETMQVPTALEWLGNMGVQMQV